MIKNLPSIVQKDVHRPVTYFPLNRRVQRRLENLQNLWRVPAGARSAALLTLVDENPQRDVTQDVTPPPGRSPKMYESRNRSSISNMFLWRCTSLNHKLP